MIKFVEQAEEENKDKKKEQWEETGERGDRERGVRVANKQKVNTSGGNTVTLDAADGSSTCPLKFPRRPFCGPQDKSSAKSQHLSSPWVLRDKERKKAIQHLCLLRLKHVALSASLPSSLSSLSPQRYLYRTRGATVSELSLSISPKKSSLLFFVYAIVCVSLWRTL